MPEPTFLNDPYIRTSAVLDLIRRVLRRLLAVTAVVTVLAAAAGLVVGGLPGLWAALMAAGIGLFFTATTVLGLYLVAGRGPELLQVVILGGWIVKMAVLAVLLLWLREQDFYHRGTFIATIIGLVLAALVVEMYTVATARIPYVQPGAGGVTEAPGTARARPLPAATDTAGTAQDDTLGASGRGSGEGSGPSQPGHNHET